MSDNVAITAGSGTNIAADDRSSVYFQEVVSVGGSGWDADVLAPTSTATSASIAARAKRTRVVIYNTGTVNLYLSDLATNGGASTTDNSFGPLLPGASVTQEHVADIFIFTASGTGAATYWEEFDNS